MTEESDKAFNAADPEHMRARADIYFIIGVTLEAFAILEESLAALYGLVSKIPVVESAFLAHISIRDFSSRLEMTSAVLIAELESSKLPDKDEVLAEWKSLKRACEESSHDRNRIAHFRTYARTKGDGFEWVVLPYFQPWAYFSALGDPDEIPKGVRVLTPRAIQEKAEKMERTTKRIDALIGTLMKQGYLSPTARKHQKL